MKLISTLVFCCLMSTNVMATQDDKLRFCDSDCTSEFQFFRKFSREGSSLAHHSLSTMYLLGMATDKNVKVGLRHLNKAVKANEPAAIFQKAYFYHRGIFLEQNTDKALLLYEKAKRLRVKGATEKLSLLLSEVKAAKNPKKTITDKFGRSTSPSLVQHFDENIERQRE